MIVTLMLSSKLHHTQILCTGEHIYATVKRGKRGAHLQAFHYSLACCLKTAHEEPPQGVYMTVNWEPCGISGENLEAENLDSAVVFAR